MIPPPTQFAPGSRLVSRADYRKIKRLTRDEVMQVANVLLKSSVEGLEKLAQDNTAPVIVSTFAHVILRIRHQGDLEGLLLLLDRIIGSDVDASLRGSGGPSVTISIPSNGRDTK
jgi:hypothetical protein